MISAKNNVFLTVVETLFFNLYFKKPLGGSDSICLDLHGTQKILFKKISSSNSCTMVQLTELKSSVFDNPGLIKKSFISPR